MEKKIKEMYTEYTYPKYEKYMDEYKPVPNKFSHGLFLEQINHYIYKGKKNNFENYSVLVVGVGLGQDIINMGFLLKEYKTRLVGIDLSSTSLNICKERLKKYDLENDIELIEMSLLDLDPKVHGKFDCIICIGVLHHLEDPQIGLNCINKVLKDDGFMYIMVYGKYGRTGIYQMQDLMKKINYNCNDFKNKINNFKNTYKQLPENNWFKKGENLVNDHNISDEGIVDMLLHHQDRAYSIPELYEWINNSGLNIIEFSAIYRYKYKYDIDGIKYPDNIIEKYSINELFFGDIKMHTFYLSKNKNTKASINELDNILLLESISKENLNKILEFYKLNKVNNLNVNLSLTHKINNKYQWDLGVKFINLNILMNDIIYTILNNIDNKRKIREIFDIVRDELNINNTNNELLTIFKPTYEKFELYDFILLKAS